MSIITNFFSQGELTEARPAPGPQKCEVVEFTEDTYNTQKEHLLSSHPGPSLSL
jgi:hypothetical protein